MRPLAATQLEGEHQDYDTPKALGTKVIVKPRPDTFVSPAGLIFDSHNIGLSKLQFGHVVAVGPDITSAINVGDLVCWQRMWGWPLGAKYGDLLVLDDHPKADSVNPNREGHILAVIGDCDARSL
jgi:co-chaperonin GroES (HSP10)